MRPTYQTINPASGQLLQTFAHLSDHAVDMHIDQASLAFRGWRNEELNHKSEVLRKAADILEHNAENYGALMELEMGKPAAQGVAESKKCALTCRFYADHAEKFLTPENRQTDSNKSLVRFEPLGPILAIMPWNFPFWQVFRVAAPNLMAGNVILLKHAENVPQCALAIEAIFAEAGLLKGAFQSLFATHEQVATIIADPRIRGVTLTGSSRAGAQVGTIAGQHLKKTVMELGGSDAFIVFDDCDVEAAVEAGVTSRCLNNGQSCIAAKRFFVQAGVAKTFMAGFVPRMRAQDTGPLATKKQQQLLSDQVEDAKRKGATVLCGGEMPNGEGCFYPPSILINVTPDMRAFHEELFGPVAVVHQFFTDEEVVTLANGSQFGLGANLWTKNAKRIEMLTRELEAGSVFVNDYVRSDPRLPFGGVKGSGHGRELGVLGMREFVNIKTVWIK